MREINWRRVRVEVSMSERRVRSQGVEREMRVRVECLDSLEAEWEVVGGEGKKEGERGGGEGQRNAGGVMEGGRMEWGRRCLRGARRAKKAVMVCVPLGISTARKKEERNAPRVR